MKKLAAVFLTLLFASTASAQVISNPTRDSRMAGMGVANWQIEDDFNIFINPAQLSNYKNNVYGELGTYTAANPSIGGGAGLGPNQDGIGFGSQWGGMNMDVSYGGWGVYLGRPYAGPLNAAATAIGGLPGVAPLTAPLDNRFDLFYATHGMPLGFYLSYASRAADVKTAGVKTTNDASEINLGVGGLVMNNMLDVALNLGMPSFETNNGTTKVQTDGAINVALLGRLHTGLGGNAKLLTTGQILLGDASLKATGGTKVGLTSNTIRVDTAVNSMPNPNTLLVAGVGIASTSTEAKPKPAGSKTTTSNLTIPVNVAVEHQTFKVVKTRIGLSSALYNTTDCKNVDPTCTTAGASKVTKVADGTATVSMGFGWAVADNLMLDAVINQDILFSGTYVVSGVAETLSSMLSATYRFK
ncbi:MAG: hypothetical protein HY283_01415 [Nitrospirae bacterium]|nr:hypothetical protein [Nitrospirota bacterium]